MPDCFIIMPISTPSDLVEGYHRDPDHFQHVLEHLFVPAIERVGYTAVPPAAEGADLIHASIIRNLETADLVLCDMSSLNPNVFFELGIRTALNKPACHVKDLHTTRIPFDLGSINCHTYNPDLRPWCLTAEIPKLAAHLQKTIERSQAINPMWQYFGLSRQAKLELSESPIEAKLDYILGKLEANKAGDLDSPNLLNASIETFKAVRDICSVFGMTTSTLGMGTMGISLEIDRHLEELPEAMLSHLQSIADSFSRSVILYSIFGGSRTIKPRP